MIFSLDQKPADSTALVEADTARTLTYGQLAEDVRTAAEILRRGGRRLVFLLTSNTIQSITAYLACLETGLPLCLVESSPDWVPQRMLEAYRPELVLEGMVPRR